MASPPKSDILEFPANIIDTIRKSYGLGEPGKIDEALDNFQGWIKSQNNFLKKDFDRYYLETCLITCKGDLDRAKARFEKLCILRTVLPEFFDTCSAKELNGVENIIGGVLPKLNTNNYRVAVLKDVGSGYGPEIFKNFLKLVTILAEYLRSHDYCDGYVIVFDFMEANLTEILSSINLVDLRHILTLLMDGYGMRMKGIHLITSPSTSSSAIDMAVNIIKGFVSEKIADRIHIHKAVDTIYEHVPKNILPAEYGGSEASLKDITAKWLNILGSQEHVNYMKEINKAKIETSSIDALKEQHLGTSTDFRKLEVD